MDSSLTGIDDGELYFPAVSASSGLRPEDLLLWLRRCLPHLLVRTNDFWRGSNCNLQTLAAPRRQITRRG